MWIHGLLEADAEFFPYGLELLEVFFILRLVFHLHLDTFEDSDGGGKIIHAAGSAKGSYDDRGGGDEIVGEGVVQVALELENVLDAIEFVLVSLCKLLKRLLAVGIMGIVVLLPLQCGGEA